MNKTNLMKEVPERMRTQSNAAKVIGDAIFDGMKESLENAERIEVRGVAVL